MVKMVKSHQSQSCAMELPMANEFTGELFIHIMEIRKAKSYIGLIQLAENVAAQSDSLGTRSESCILLDSHLKSF